MLYKVSYRLSLLLTFIGFREFVFVLPLKPLFFFMCKNYGFFYLDKKYLYPFAQTDRQTDRQTDSDNNCSEEV